MASIERLRQAELEPRKIGDLVVRPARIEDIEEVCDLYMKDFPEHILVRWDVLSNPEAMKEQFQLENKYWIVAEKEGELKGCMSIEVIDWNKSAEIERVVTAAEYRGNGVATEMCRAATEFSENLGVQYLVANCRAPEFGMQRALQKQGFAVMGIEPCFFVHDEKTREYFVKMAKFLNGAKEQVLDQVNLVPEAKQIMEIIKAQYLNN